MAASLSTSIVDAAPGNIVTLQGQGLVAGSGASVRLDSQGVTAAPGLSPTTITLHATFNTTNVQIVIPDGVMDGTLTVTAGDATAETCALRACSQYIQASEYIGEGEDVSKLAHGELDIILRRASSDIDSMMGDGVRLLQKVENPRYRENKKGPPVIRPYRCRGRRCPIQSVDQLTFISAKDLVTVFNVGDIYVNTSLDYSEVLAYAVGNFALLGELQTIGYSANVLQLAYTSGYTMAKYPSEIRSATIMMATTLLNKRRRQKMGMGPYSQFMDKIKIDPVGVETRKEVRRLIAPWTISTLS
jgi:hypothetical protein